MNDLGIALAWLAVQVTLVLVPSLAVLALASRRGPASGAWVSALSLGLIVVLSVSSLIAGSRRRVDDDAKATALAESANAATPSPVVTDNHSAGPEASSPRSGIGWDLSKLRLAWDRFGRGAAEPAARVRPWGVIVAAVSLAGMAFGLVRLLTGLWAVGVCRRRGRVVDDPAMTGLLDQLRGEMGCLRTVELREAADLTTPATAGWLRPVVLLPDDWREWSADERRAVLAHELAHVVRGDYAAGVVARIAVVLNTFHPLVRWMAGRLDVQQEQAADALAARFAGGRAGYLTALARLALKQDGRSPRWPAREFLPDRGTLIRRIAMLRDQTDDRTLDRASSRSLRVMASFTLLGLTVGVAMLRGPARAGDEKGTAAGSSAKAQTPAVHEPITPVYVPDGANGLIAFRPASLFHRMGMGEGLMIWISEFAGIELWEFGKKLEVDTSRPGFLKLSFDDVEWATCGIRFRPMKSKEHGDLHRIEFSGLTVRTFAPVDWLGFLRQWRVELTEVRVGETTYYQIKGPVQPMLGPHPCVYLIDDRTIALDEEAGIRSIISNTAPSRPAFLQGSDWERASRGLLAVTIDNQNPIIAKQYDRGRPADALLKSIDRWTVGVDDADSIALHLTGACRGREVSEAIARAFGPLLKQARDATDKEVHASAASPEYDKLHNLMIKTLVANIRVEPTDRSIDLLTDRFGTLADVAWMVEALVKDVREARDRRQAASAKLESTKR